MKWLVVTAFVLVVSPAAASTEIRPGSDTTLPYVEWIADAQVPTPDARVWVYRDACPFSSYNCTDGRTIWLDPREHNPEAMFFHELGHIFDRHDMRRVDREAYRAIVGLHGRWRFGLEEDFAISYQLCSQGDEGPVCDWLRTTWPRRSYRRAGGE